MADPEFVQRRFVSLSLPPIWVFAVRVSVPGPQAVNSSATGGGEYPTQDGFGWTNGVLMTLIKKYGIKYQVPTTREYKNF